MYISGSAHSKWRLYSERDENGLFSSQLSSITIGLSSCYNQVKYEQEIHLWTIRNVKKKLTFTWNAFTWLSRGFKTKSDWCRLVLTDVKLHVESSKLCVIGARACLRCLGCSTSWKMLNFLLSPKGAGAGLVLTAARGAHEVRPFFITLSVWSEAFSSKTVKVGTWIHTHIQKTQHMKQTALSKCTKYKRR